MLSSQYINTGLFSSLLLSLILSGCGRAVNSAGASIDKANETGPVPVQSAEAVVKEVPVFIQATGSLIAQEISDIAPETSGQVVATPVEVGVFVKQGTVIARLDAGDARARLEQAKATEQQALSTVRQAEARLGLSSDEKFDVNSIPEVRAAREQYEAAEAQARLAETNARRYANLVETGDVSRAVYDQARTQAETARAQAKASRGQYEVAINSARQNNQAIATARAQLSNARAQVSLAQNSLSYTVVKAPFSGYINDRPVAVGEYVTTQSKIATILRTNPIKLLLQIPEADAGKVSPGMSVSTSFTAYPDRTFSGEVRAIVPALETTSRTMTAEITIDNPDNLLRPGMFATARIIQPEGKQGIFVPRSALMKDSTTNSASVYVIDGNVTRLRVVQSGEEEGDMVRILTGVSAGEIIVTSNLNQLFDGATIQRQ
jgi:RND family efflux transporter MFP subunit